jgi:Major intrinsic protein
MRNPTETGKAKAHYPTLRRLQYFFIGPSGPRPATARIAALVIETTPGAGGRAAQRTEFPEEVAAGLVRLVLSTAVARRAGSVAPLAIGMTLTFNILMGGPLTGAAFNPARALGPMVATGNFSDAWLYLTAPIVGATVAAILHIGLVRLAQERTAGAEPDRIIRAPAK